MNAWLDRINGILPQVQQQPQMSGLPMFQSPVQKMNYIMQAMTNPAQFVKQHFPDIPDNILNDPNQVGQYLQQRYGAPGPQAQQFARQNAMYPPRRY